GADCHPAALDEVTPEREAEAGSPGSEDVPVLERDLLLDQVVEEGVVAAGELEDGRARRGDAEVQAGGEENGRAPEMRRHREPLAGGQRRDRPHLGDPPRDGGIRLQDVDGARVEHLAEGEARLLALAGWDRE